MKHLRNVLGILLILSLAFLHLNCEQKSSTGPTTPISESIIGEVQLTGATQLYAVASQSVTTDLTATVTDTTGDAISGILVKFSTPQFGSISITGADTTNAQGQVKAEFNSQGEFGLATVKATVTAGEVEHSDTLSIGVYELAGLPYDIYLSVNPSVLYLPEGENGTLSASVVVYDSLGVGLPGIQVNFTTTLGSIQLAQTTGSNGGLSTPLQSLEEFGMGIVTASVLTSIPDTSETTSGDDPGSKEEGERQSDDLFELVAVDTFYINTIDDRIAGISISASPANLSVAPNEIGTSTIRATVIDENNVGIPGVPVSFRTTSLGVLSSDAGTTDSSGVKTVTFSSVPNQVGNAMVWADAGDFTDSTSINIMATQGESGQIILSTDEYVIYADNGITTATVTALLQDADYQVIAGVPVIFTSNYGSVNSPVTTDSSGIATALFRDIGLPSFPDSTTIIAKYPPLNVSDTVRVMIAPALGIDYIQLASATTSMLANGLDSSRVDAIVYLDNGMLAPEGTEVTFLVEGQSIGDISPTIAQVSEAGTATAWYRTGITVGIDTLYAVVEGVYSNPVVMEINPGPPSNVSLSVDPSSISVNSAIPIVVTATVTDTTGNRVDDGEGVYFTASLGSINPPQVPTVGGEAVTELLPGTTAGQSWIKAQVGTAIDSILVTFTPIDPAYISLTADWTEIAISPGGDTTFTPIHAHIKDASGNYVGNGIMVHFEIVNGFPGGGVNINNHGLEDSTVTSGGIASVVLNAGLNPGPVQIRAWTYNNEVPPVEISAQQALVTIVAGPPAHIDINFMSDPQTGGGDVWNIEVSALVEDAQGNEVPDGISVSFTIIPDTIAEIQGGAVTGNENWDGGTQPGVAFTTLSYHSDEIFEEITVVAYTVTGEDTITGTQEKTLPIDNEGELYLTVSPIAWNYSTMPPPADPAIMEMRVTLKDGHENHVNGGVILFQSPKGRAFRYSNGQGETWYAITGPEGFTTPPPPEQQDSTGVATLWLRTTFAEAFPDPNALETTAQITAILQDYDITSQPQTVTFIHNLGEDLGP